jgi:hypothetical protein
MLPQLERGVEGRRCSPGGQHNALPATSLPHSTRTPETGPSRPIPGETVRHEHPAEAHASPHHTDSARPRACGEADNPGEADQHHQPEFGRSQRSG